MSFRQWGEKKLEIKVDDRNTTLTLRVNVCFCGYQAFFHKIIFLLNFAIPVVLRGKIWYNIDAGLYDTRERSLPYESFIDQW